MSAPRSMPVPFTASRAAAALRRVIPARYRPIGYLNHLTRERTGGRVRMGPFAGMRYVDTSVGSCFIPKLLGIYERELAPKVEIICRYGADLIVDVGAAEGYYAVGLALRNPRARVIAFEMEEPGRRALSEMARLNRVTDRLLVRGRCELEDLAAVLDGEVGPIVVCDVEGYEEKLLDSVAVPTLRGTAMLVETHEFVHPGITDELRARFASTHEIDLIWQEPRSRAEFPWRTIGTALLPASYLDWAVSEWRPMRMCWLWMTPRAVRE